MKTKIRKIQGGVPSGGLTGQVLVKQSNTDNDVAWGAVSGGGGGGFNTVSLLAGNTFDTTVSPRAITVLEGEKQILQSGSAFINQNLGDQLSNLKYCYQLNICEGQVVNIDKIIVTNIQGQGTNSDNITLSIQGNSGGVPDGVAIQSSTIPGFTGLANAVFTFTPFELNAVSGGGDLNYFVVLERTGSVSLSNYYILGLTNSGGTNTSPYRYNGSTLAWVDSDLKFTSAIYFTYLNGTAYQATRGLSATTKTANGKTGTVQNGTRIFAYDVGSSGGGWNTDAGFVGTDGQDLATIRGFLTADASIGDTVTVAIAGGVSGFSGLEAGTSYILARDDSGGIVQGTTSSYIEAGQAIKADTLLIQRAIG